MDVWAQLVLHLRTPDPDLRSQSVPRCPNLTMAEGARPWLGTPALASEHLLEFQILIQLPANTHWEGSIRWAQVLGPLTLRQEAQAELLVVGCVLDHPWPLQPFEERTSKWQLCLSLSLSPIGQAHFPTRYPVLHMPEWAAGCEQMGTVSIQTGFLQAPQVSMAPYIPSLLCDTRHALHQGCFVTLGLRTSKEKADQQAGDYLKTKSTLPANSLRSRAAASETQLSHTAHYAQVKGVNPVTPGSPRSKEGKVPEVPRSLPPLDPPHLSWEGSLTAQLAINKHSF